MTVASAIPDLRHLPVPACRSQGTHRQSSPPYRSWENPPLRSRS